LPQAGADAMMEVADDTEASSSSDLASREVSFSLFVNFAKEVV